MKIYNNKSAKYKERQNFSDSVKEKIHGKQHQKVSSSTGNPDPPGEPTGNPHQFRNCHGNPHGQDDVRIFLVQYVEPRCPKKHEGLATQAVYVCPCLNKMIAV